MDRASGNSQLDEREVLIALMQVLAFADRTEVSPAIRRSRLSPYPGHFSLTFSPGGEFVTVLPNMYRMHAG